MDRKNGKTVGMIKGRAKNVWNFPSYEFWNNLGCLVLVPTFDLGGSRLWKKEEEKMISKDNIINV